MGIVEEFEEFKAQLREKWLDYCERNQSYLQVWYNNSSLIDQDFILGVITVIEPKVIQWINFYKTHIQPKISVNNSIDFLGLNFDYKKALETRKEERAKNQLIEPPSPLDEFRNKNI